MSIVLVWYSLLSLVLLLPDLFEKPSWIRQYKVQPLKNQQVHVQIPYINILAMTSSM